MTDEEYLSTQSQLILITDFMTRFDFSGFLARIEQAETLAPIVDPTLYIKGATRLRDIKELAQAAQKFQRAAVEFRKQVAEQWEREVKR